MARHCVMECVNDMSRSLMQKGIGWVVNCNYDLIWGKGYKANASEVVIAGRSQTGGRHRGIGDHRVGGRRLCAANGAAGASQPRRHRARRPGRSASQTDDAGHGCDGNGNDGLSVLEGYLFNWKTSIILISDVTR